MTPGIQELMREVERIRDAFAGHVRAGDVDAALALLTDDCHVLALPLGTGGRGHADLRRFLTDEVVGRLPDDLAIRRVSRTADRFRVVDEQVVSFTHSGELPWLLPGVPATGRHAEVLVVTVVAVRQFRITAHRTLWDVHTLLDQLGVEKSQVRALSPVPEASGSAGGASGP